MVSVPRIMMIVLLPAVAGCEQRVYVEDKAPVREGMTCNQYMTEYAARPREGTMSMKAFAEGYEKYCRDEGVLFKRQ